MYLSLFFLGYYQNKTIFLDKFNLNSEICINEAFKKTKKNQNTS